MYKEKGIRTFYRGILHSVYIIVFESIHELIVKTLHNTLTSLIGELQANLC